MLRCSTNVRTTGGQRAGFGAQPAHIEPSLQSRGFLRRQPSPHNPISRFLLLGEASSYRTGSLRTGGRRRGTKSCGRGPCRRRWSPGIIKCESSTSAGASAWSCGASRNLPACTTRAGSRRLSLSRPVVGSRGPPFFSRFLCARLLFNYGCLQLHFPRVPAARFCGQTHRSPLKRHSTSREGSRSLRCGRLAARLDDAFLLISPPHTATGLG